MHYFVFCLAGLLGALMFIGGMADLGKNGGSFSSLISMILLAVFLVCGYFLPTLIASFRKHHNSAAICVTNIFFGWTIVAWFAALIWSFTAVDDVVRRYPT
jgi:hypothetical protein